MLSQLLQRRSPEALQVAQEKAIVHPKLRYLMVRGNSLVFVLEDGNSITLSAPNISLEYLTALPSVVELRELRQVNVVGGLIEINLGTVKVELTAKDGDKRVDDPTWSVSVEGGDRVRRRITNRFLRNGKRWPHLIALDYRPWRYYDVDSQVDFEEGRAKSILPKARDGEAKSETPRQDGLS